MDLDEGILYRLAYSMAYDLAEGAEQNYPGRWRNNGATGGTLERILAEVLRRLRIEDHERRELAREAVEDALTGRRPKW